MEGKPQHRQHFNLSEAAKQMLEELTARRYPGRQRRQSQLVEDLIAEAFEREQEERRGGESEEGMGKRVGSPSLSGIGEVEAPARGGREVKLPGLGEVDVEDYQYRRVRTGKRMVAEGRSKLGGVASHLCPTCRREVQGSWKYCVYCGGELVRSCGRCGTPWVEARDARYCCECGYALER